MADDALNTLITIQRHREFVRNELHELADELRKRARHHDQTKLKADEFDGFVRVNTASKKWGYGSEEMRRLLSEEDCVELHQMRNSHHPEYHLSVDEMGFLDIIEMVIDWWAASVAYGNTGFLESLPSMKERYNFTDSQWWLITQVASWIVD